MKSKLLRRHITVFRVFDKLLMGQYPTGAVFEWSNGTLSFPQNSVGVEPGVSTFSHEAMTLAIYGDDVLLAGDVAVGHSLRKNLMHARRTPSGRCARGCLPRHMSRATKHHGWVTSTTTHTQ